MKAQRSNTATRLRRHCAALFGVSEADMLLPDKRREKFRGRIGWVDSDQGIGSYSSVDVEILHKDFTGHYDLRTAFLNPILMWVSYLMFLLLNVSRNSPAIDFQVFVAIIRGPTAAKELMNGIQSNPKTDTMARKHGIRHTTPGAIAGSVVLVRVTNASFTQTYSLSQSRWALSADDCLQSVGANTGINYGRDFEEYLEVLMTGLQKKKKSVLNIFRQWDQVIFPNSDSSLVGHADKDTSRGLKTALMMLEADEVEENETTAFE